MHIPEECIGFNWDKGNANKNWEKHQVTQQEAEEIFFNEPLLVTIDEKHSQTEYRFYALGQTDNRRALFIAFTVRKKHIRIISARNMSAKERKVYNEQRNTTF